MSKYMVAKSAAILFSLTTVMIFFMAQSGALFARSIEFGVVLYGINTTLLIVSLLVFFWQRAHRDLPKRLDLRTLETYASLQSEDVDTALPVFTVNQDDLRSLRGGSTLIVSVMGQDSAATPLRIGDTIRLKSTAIVQLSDIVEIVLIEGDVLTVRLRLP